MLKSTLALHDRMLAILAKNLAITNKYALVSKNILLASGSAVTAMDVERSFDSMNDLEPGKIYTKDTIVKFFGISNQPGIVESKSKNCILLFSSYKMAGKFNDRYDPHTGVYIFNGVGNKTDSNSKYYTKVMDTVENGKPIHLFVATSDIGQEVEDDELKGYRMIYKNSYYIYCGEVAVIDEGLETDISSGLPMLRFIPQDEKSFTQAYMQAEAFSKQRAKAEAARKEKKKRMAEQKKQDKELNKQIKEFNKEHDYRVGSRKERNFYR